MASVRRIAYLGLGSNLGARKKNIRSAIELIDRTKGVTVVQVSHLYNTPPQGIPTDKPFKNAVIAIETSLGPRSLMEEGLNVERALGRDRTKGCDREIDVDILYFNGCTIWEHDIKVPHPRLAQRAFVLIPWSEIAPSLFLRPWMKTVGQLLAMLDASSMEGITCD